MCCIWGWIRLCKKDEELPYSKRAEEAPETDTFCTNAEHTPQYADVLGKVKWFIVQFLLLAPIIEFLLMAVDGHTSGSAESALYVCSSLTWLSTLIGWYGISTIFSWMRPVELTYNADLHENDSLMLGHIDEEHEPRDGGLRGSREAAARSSLAHSGVGAGGTGADVIQDKADTRPTERPTVDRNRGDNLREGEVQGSDLRPAEESACSKCCKKCTANTQLCWDILLEKVFREEPNTFGEQFCARRKLVWITAYFLQTLTLTGFMRLFMPRLVVKNGVWLNELQMCHAWTAFVVLCASLPLALMAWFAFPVSAIPEEREPMRKLSTRVIRGPRPRPYPPEGILVDQLSTLIPILDDRGLSKASGGLHVERNPQHITAQIGRKVDLL